MGGAGGGEEAGPGGSCEQLSMLEGERVGGSACVRRERGQLGSGGRGKGEKVRDWPQRAWLGDVRVRRWWRCRGSRRVTCAMVFEGIAAVMRRCGGA